MSLFKSSSFWILIMLGTGLPQMITVSFTTVYYLKKRTMDGLLMSIGGVVGILIGLVTVVMKYSLEGEAIEASAYVTVVASLKIAAVLFNILYVAGFVWLITKVTKSSDDDSA